MKSIYSNENCYSPTIYNNFSNISLNELDTFIPKFTYDNEDSNILFSEHKRDLFKDELLNKEKESQNKNFLKNIHLESQIKKDVTSKNNDFKQYSIEPNTKNSSKILGNKIRINFDEIEISENENKNKIEKQKGRKRKGEIDKGIHNKYSEDNIMRKIKSYFVNYCYNLLNRSLKDKNLVFVRLTGNISKNLKKDYNLNLLDRTIKDLYSNSIISGKYVRNKKKSF